MIRTSVAALLFVITAQAAAWAELKLPPIRLEESGQETFDQTLSLSGALQSVELLKGVLTSFRELTEASKRLLPRKKLQDIGNTGWEIQHIGFRNMPQVIEGVLRKQEYLLKKLQLDLAREKFRQGEAGKEDLASAEQEALEAEKQFQAFWDGFRLTD